MLFGRTRSRSLCASLTSWCVRGYPKGRKQNLQPAALSPSLINRSRLQNGRSNRLRCLPPGADAIRYTDPIKRVAGDAQTGQFLQEFFYLRHAFQMPGLILRQSTGPAEDAGKTRRDAETKSVFHFLLHDRLQSFVGVVEQLRHARAGNETAQQGGPLWRAMGKLVMNERAGQHGAVLARGDKKTVTQRKVRAVVG